MLEELKTFISVVEHRNFTKAAHALNLSQPSVSTHIKNLESHFGVILINRSVKQKSIFITESGYTLYRRAKEIMNLLDTTYLEVKNNSNSVKGNLKIGASLTIGEYILPKFLSVFSQKYPDIDVEIFIDNTSSICCNLKDLTLDIGLIEGTPSFSTFNQEYFLEDKMVLAFPFKNEIDVSRFTFDNLQNQKWIVREEGSGTREFLNMFLATNEIIPKNIMVLGSNYAVKEAVKNNLGITIISSFVTQSDIKSNELFTIELGDSYIRHFSYISPKNINISKASQIFLDELKMYSSTLSNI